MFTGQSRLHHRAQHQDMTSEPRRAATRGRIPTAKVLRGQQLALELVSRGATQREVLDVIAQTAEEALGNVFAAVLLPDGQSPQGVRVGGRGRASDALQGAMPRLMPAGSLRGENQDSVPGVRIYTDDVLGSPALGKHPAYLPRAGPACRLAGAGSWGPDGRRRWFARRVPARGRQPE